MIGKWNLLCEFAFGSSTTTPNDKENSTYGASLALMVLATFLLYFKMEVLHSSYIVAL